MQTFITFLTILCSPIVIANPLQQISDEDSKVMVSLINDEKYSEYIKYTKTKNYCYELLSLHSRDWSGYTYKADNIALEDHTITLRGNFSLSLENVVHKYTQQLENSYVIICKESMRIVALCGSYKGTVTHLTPTK